MKKTANLTAIAREEADLAHLLASLPANPVPWAAIVRLIAPLVARLAIRYALKRLKRSLSEEKVTAAGDAVGKFISNIIEKRTPGDSP